MNFQAEKLKIGDFAFIAMMGFLNVPNLLEVWGIDTIFKPYRVLALAIAFFSIPRLLKAEYYTRRLAVPILFAIIYTSCMLLFIGGVQYLIEQIPFIATCVCLLLSTFAISSSRTIFLSLYASALSFLLSAYFGIIAFNQGKYRLSGLFENPNTFGYAGCFVILFAINRFFPIPMIVRWMLALCAIPTMVLTGSRGAILSVAGGFLSQVYRNPRLLVSVGAFVVVICVLGSYLAPSLERYTSRNVFDRITNRQVIARGSAGRIAIAKAGLQVAAEHGFVGIGLGQYQERHHTRFFRQVGLDGRINKLELHNFYVAVLCEWGVVGMLCFALVFYRLVSYSKDCPRAKDWVFGFLGVSLANGFASSLITQVHFWIMLGISIQFVRLENYSLAAQAYRDRLLAIARSGK